MYYPINESTARLAHEMMFMSDYKPGSATEEYRASVDKATALVEQRKAVTSPWYHEKLEALLDSYARRLAQWTNDYNCNGASCPSILVSGGSNFPVKKKQRQNAREDALWKEYENINGILEKIKNTGSGSVDLAHPYAREILTERLEHLQKKLNDGKAMNTWYRKHKTLKGFPGMSDEAAARNDAALASLPAFAQRPMPDFELASLRSKIKRVQGRLAELDALKDRQTAPDSDTEFDGGRIVRNAEQNRLQIIFEDIPSPDLRAQLKSEGFHWSPKNKAWQRQLTENAERAARRVLHIA